MIILNTDLKKFDLEFLVADLNSLIAGRESKGIRRSLRQERMFEKTIEKALVPLAERGQIEAMQKYCETLPATSPLNSKVVSNFHNLERKNVKEPRDYLALSSFYNWFVEYYRLTYHSLNVETTEEFKKAHDYYRRAGQMLYQIGKTDPIAKETAFLMQKKNRELMSQEEYNRSMSNSRNQIFSIANHQTNDNLRLKLMISYCQNLIRFAPDNEYNIRQPTLTGVIATMQKRMLVLDELSRG